MSVPVDDPRTRSEFLAAIAACHDRLVSQGTDLSAFDLREMAADAEDLRTAGNRPMERAKLGTTSRIALSTSAATPTMRVRPCWIAPEWPGWIRSSSVQATRHALAELLAACAASVVCRRLAPHLGRDLDTVLRRLHAKPYVADLGEKRRVYFDAGWLLVWLRARLSGLRPPGTFIPHAIAEFARGSDRVLRMQASRLLRRKRLRGSACRGSSRAAGPSWSEASACTCR